VAWSRASDQQVDEHAIAAERSAIVFIAALPRCGRDVDQRDATAARAYSDALVFVINSRETPEDVPKMPARYDRHRKSSGRRT
jgi:hypothetical protein